MGLARDYLERAEIRVLESPLGQRALAWHRRLPDRDQFLFNLLAVGLLALLIVLTVLLPASRYAMNSVASYHQARDDFRWLQSNEQAAMKVSAAQLRPADINSLTSTAVSSAQAFGLEFRRYEPTADGDLRVWLEQVSFDSVVSWLQDMTVRYQLNVDSITISPENKGVVDVRLEIKG